MTKTRIGPKGGDGHRHHVVIVGGGFGGLSAARALRRAEVEVTLIDRTNHHLFQPLLYQVATGILSEGEIAPPIREVLRHQENTRVLLGEVVDIDVGARQLSGVSTVSNGDDGAAEDLTGDGDGARVDGGTVLRARDGETCRRCRTT